VAAGPVGRISILTDSESWLNDFVPILVEQLLRTGHRAHWSHSHRSLTGRDICSVLGYSRILDEKTLSMHTHNLVTHESDLPRGRGWFPLTWQVLEGIDEINVSLIEAVLEVDAGRIYAQDTIRLRGDEFIDGLRIAQWKVTRRLCMHFVDEYPHILGDAGSQQGDPSFYPRRQPEASRIDLQKTLAEQMSLLRVVDNRCYPAFFEWRGRRVRLEVQPESTPSAE
jgi:methionyl-tRNA formyltransferase